MRNFLVAVAALFGLITGYSQELNIATYNIRYDNAGDAKDNPWQKRLPPIVNIINNASLDVFGTQEGLFNQLADLMRALPAYEYTGIGRNGGREGEHASIWYKREKFTLLQSGNFWLSQTPDVVSKGWDAKFERICSWAKFSDKQTGFTFYFFNTHFDHKGMQARKNSIDLIFQQIDKIAGNTPAILSGDFNMQVADPAYTEFAKYTRFKNAHDVAAEVKDGNSGTSNHFDTSYRINERIDHIFVSGDFKVNTYSLAKDQYDGFKYPSDHFPVILTIQLQHKADDNAKMYAGFPEDFENAPAKIKYNRAGIKLKTGDWILDKCVLQNTANDVPASGAFAARFVGDNTTPAYLQMDFDLPNGASKVTVAYSSYAAKADALSMWTLEYSTDKGRTWQQTGHEVVAENKKSKATAVFNLNIQGTVRFRINKLGAGTQQTDATIKNGRLSIDDFAVYQF